MRTNNILSFALATAMVWQPGVYRDKAPGYGGDVLVTAVVREGRIESLATQNTGGDKSEYYLRAEEELTRAILAANGLEGVDTVSGATGTSESILAAMQGILEQAAYAGEVSSVKAPTLTADPKPTI